ncbi:MAG: hypothetical protein M0Z81_12775, partial [Deltaproteobacteria bacterium]|nr:hypothetical protein [Deltaproteobacteria bacterium]
MAKYIALDTLKKSADEVMTFVADISPNFARAMAVDTAPAKCIKIWNPIPNGRTDYVFCLWEAENPEEINIAIEALRDYLTVDIFKVDEIDWKGLAESLNV